MRSSGREALCSCVLEGSRCGGVWEGAGVKRGGGSMPAKDQQRRWAFSLPEVHFSPTKMSTLTLIHTLMSQECLLMDHKDETVFLSR